MCERTAEQLTLHQNLVEQTLLKRGVKLTIAQELEFRNKCWALIENNPNCVFNHYLHSANYILNFILDV